jgi:hypothetical protein
MDDILIRVPNATRSLVFGLCCHLLLCGALIPLVGGYIAAFGPLLVAFAGLMAGISAIRIIMKEPDVYTGMGLAIAGTVISGVSLFAYGIFSLLMCTGLIMSLV